VVGIDHVVADLERALGLRLDLEIGDDGIRVDYFLC
jgi:hypothetical protein